MTTRFRLADALGESSQSELSRESGVAFSTINRMCRNATARVDLETLDKLSEVLGCAPGDLLERVEGKRKKVKKRK